MREHVQALRALGWATVRIPPLSKAPIERDWPRTDYPPEAFAPGDNVGIKLGDPSGGLVDVDLDCLEAVALAPRFLPPSATFGRPSKARSHWIFHCPGIPRSRKLQRAKIELRSTGGQTVFPPSIHESGEPITWHDATPVASVDPATLLAAWGKLAIATTVARVWPALPGAKHDAVLALAGALWHEGWTAEDALAVLLPGMELDGSSEPHREAAILDTWGDHDRNRPGWPTLADLIGPPDAKGIQRAAELVPTAPRGGAVDGEGRPLTDLGNAERLLDEHGEDLRFVPGLHWLQWDGARWDPLGPKVEPVELMARSVRGLQRLGAETGQPAITKFGFQCESAGKIRSAIGLARDLPGIRTAADALDRDPWLLCCPNGTLDLRTGQLHEHDRAHLITRMTNASFDPRATADRFWRFLLEVFANDVELALYVLRYLGYSLTGITREQVFGVWHGFGANGKSTLIEAVRDVLGDYAQILAPDLLIERRNGRASESASPDIARLRGSRFAAGVETKEGQRWNESLVKQLTGSDRVVARHLHSELIEFDPSWKIVLAVNHKPIVRGTDRGMWRRIHLVPFDVSFEGREDRSLPDQLRAEASGILTMLVQACLQWQKEGLRPPQRVLAEVEDYRQGQDVIGSFLAECCTAGGDVAKSKLYQAYKHWCGLAGEFCHGKHAFNNQLRERGYEDARKAGGIVWAGLSLSSETTFGAVV